MRLRSQTVPLGWVIAAGQKHEYWDEFYSQRIIGIGRDKLGDLREYRSANEVGQALLQNYEEDFKATSPAQKARMCFDFAHSINKNDPLFVTGGQRMLLGYGIVNSEYYFDAARKGYRHVRKVLWLKKGAFAIPADAIGLGRKMLTPIRHFARLDTLMTAVGLSKPMVSEQEYSSILKRLDTLDARHEAWFRKEQSYWRDKLFGRTTKLRCGLCRKEYPADLLVTAHIKRRANCSKVEKMDMSNILPMCKFGCDDLFEKGYVSVCDGRIEANRRKPMTSVVAAYIRSLAGLKCEYWNKTSAQYFAWRHVQT
jgi:hypothetical protein